MNRCPTFHFPRIWLALFAALLWTTLISPGQAFAQNLPRQFPAAARRATLQVVAPPEIRLSGVPARLSPGARIRGVNNLLVLSGSLVGQSVLVNYLRDPLGLVHEVWILSADEAREKRPGVEGTPTLGVGSAPGTLAQPSGQ